VSPATAKRLSRGIIGVALAMIAISLIVGAASFRHQQPGRIFIVGDATVGDGPLVHQALVERQTEGETFAVEAVNPQVVIALVVGLLWMVTGSLIVSRQPRNTAGWIFLAIGVALPVGGMANTLAVTGVKTDPGSVPLVGLWAVISEYIFLPVVLLPLLFLLFPDGRPPTPRWRWADRALFAGLAIAIVGFAVSPGPLNNLVESGILYENPIGIPGFASGSSAMTTVGVVICLIAGFSTVFAVRGRFKRSTGEERQQLRWLVFVATTAGILFVFLFGLTILAGDVIGRALGGFPLFSVLLVLLAAVIAFGVPGAYLVAIFRYGLWDLDVVVRKTVVYVVLAVLLLVTGFAFVWFVTGLFASAAAPNGKVDLLSGVVIGLLFWPLRKVAVKIADRFVYGGRATPYEVLTSFAGRVGEAYSTDDILPRMVQVLGKGVGAQGATVWLRVGNELRPAMTWPDDAPASASVGLIEDALPVISDQHASEVRDQGELLGALSVIMPASDPMTPGKERLVRDLASQAGLVLRNVRLIEELRASRQRLVTAQDEERRKLERNIHDGAQQQLVALAVKLRLADTLIERDPTKAHEMMAQLQTETQEALEDLRDLARGIYPPLLADKGLPTALEAQARKAAVPTTVSADGVARYTQDVEAAVYFSCLEAMNNVAKYAEASSASVALTQTGGHLTFVITDDGRGFDRNATGYGTGLQGIADRLDAIGGTLEVRSQPGTGTTVTGRVPATVDQDPT
jgi:signal transduction histidine kinase